MTISYKRVRPTVVYVAVAAGLVVSTLILRGKPISDWGLLNPDEAELMAQARAAVLSPVPFSTWATGIGPYWILFLAGLGALGAPLTMTFAHLLSAVLLALTASALFVAASRAIGLGPAFVTIVVWWFPIAMTFPVGTPDNFSALNTEYLPTLLVVASALVPRRQLATRPWLFAVLGVSAGVAVASKNQVVPVAVAFVAAQLVVLHPGVRRTVTSLLWWLIGAVLPLAAILLIMVTSSATNWTLVDQIFSFLASYGGSNSPMHRFGKVVASFTGPGYYLLLQLAGLTWLWRHSERPSNIARIVLVAGGLMAFLAGPSSFGHYYILVFGAVGLAFTMPVKSGDSLAPERMSPRVLAGVLAISVALVTANGAITNRWRPLSPRGFAAAFSADSVHRDPDLARVCPPRSRVLLWGWKNELYIAQDWQSTSPYPEVLNLSMSPTGRASGEGVIRAGIEQSDCVVDAIMVKRPECSGSEEPKPDDPVTCLPARWSLARFYPDLAVLIHKHFRLVPNLRGCDGCSVYVRASASW